MSDRPAISTELKRRILVEAGHRCAIPTCRHSTTELAHIEPWAKIQQHTFDNLIALCPTCHTRYDKGEIDKKAMLQYKASLSLLNSRYGDLEVRILETFIQQPKTNQIVLLGGMYILLKYLIDDGILQYGGSASLANISGVPSQEKWILTDKGREFINGWVAAKELN